MTAGYQMITGPFMAMIVDGWQQGRANARLIQGLLNAGFTALMIGSVVIILSQAITRWLAQPPAARTRSSSRPVECAPTLNRSKGTKP